MNGIGKGKQKKEDKIKRNTKGNFQRKKEKQVKCEMDKEQINRINNLIKNK